jgi:hypothetical protein
MAAARYHVIDQPLCAASAASWAKKGPRELKFSDEFSRQIRQQNEDEKECQ